MQGVNPFPDYFPQQEKYESHAVLHLGFHAMCMFKLHVKILGMPFQKIVSGKGKNPSCIVIFVFQTVGGLGSACNFGELPSVLSRAPWVAMQERHLRAQTAAFIRCRK